MTKHSIPRLRTRRARLAGLMATVVVAASLSAALLARADKAPSDRTSAVADTTVSTRTLGCAGTVGVSRTSGSAVQVTCSYGARTVGAAETSTTPGAATVTTRTPQAGAGSILVATVATPASSQVTMAGWTKAFDAVSDARGVRLTGWWRPAASTGPATAGVSPAAAAAMVTVAVTGADTTSPVAAATGSTRATSGVTVDGGLWVLGLAAQGRRSIGQVGATPLASLVNGDLRLAAGTSAASARYALPTWRLQRARGTVAGVVTVRPAARAALPAGATALGSGTTTQANCGADPLDYTESGGVVTVVCHRPTPSTSAAPSSGADSSPSVSSSATPSGSTSTTPTPTDTATAGGNASDPVVAAPPAGSAPTAGAVVCGSAALNGPSAAPAGAVQVSPSQNLANVVQSHGAGTTYWLAPGTYTLGSGAYDQVQPHDGDTFVGAPGAVVDGQHKNQYAFTTGATNVTIRNLTVQNFGSAGGNNNEGVVNHDSGRGWTIAANTIQNNAGAGVMLGPDNKLIGNCLRNNGQYGFNAYYEPGDKNLLLDGNEIAGNNTDDWEKRQPDCGCTGGGKFWETNGATVTNNFVHDNHGVGLWADSNNANFLFQGNYVAGNADEGLMYETSYNAAILNNTFVRNALVKGPTNPGFPASAIYVSESGSDSRVPGPYSATFRISGNVFRDNWSGVVAWENADRFAGSPANTSTGMTTLVNPSVATVKACATASLVAAKPYFDDCRWKTQNLLVDHNTFVTTTANIPGCTADKGCGFNGLFSNYGSYPSWSPYKGTVVQDNVALHQNNVWRDNTYSGPWNFLFRDTGTRLAWNTWRSTTNGQDVGSSMG